MYYRDASGSVLFYDNWVKEIKNECFEIRIRYLNSYCYKWTWER